ncbi:zona pellucida sperm-binding protein 3 [Nematolebias whitei]|uniref:zona pellucida sperm-binding protein 3 n=1 Tax=Nematolebias whitei TaxID=451745 RepID=UPI00189702D6|nr:zona pellucida sperm-binding protein 3 [Nematolebias whitei]
MWSQKAGNTFSVDGLDIRCGESGVSVTVKRRFFKRRRVPFRPEFLTLGDGSLQRSSCGPQRPVSDTEMVLSAGLQDCGTESRVRGKWLVYSNHLFLFPALFRTSTGSAIVRGATTIVPVECHYERKQTVKGEPLAPTWVPMTSTIGAFGLLHFSLHVMAEGCSSRRASSVYQQGEAVFLEARVEAPKHPPLTLNVDSCVATAKPDPFSLPSYKFITNHGCLIDSVLPGSSSRFLPQDQDNRLCFSVRAFRFNHSSEEQMFISCHLRATPKQTSRSLLNKACFFHSPTFRWRATEGDSALCECCGSDCSLCVNMCLLTEEKHEADRTIGPLHVLLHSYWTGRLSVS